MSHQKAVCAISGATLQERKRAGVEENAWCKEASCIAFIVVRNLHLHLSTGQ